MLHHKERMGPFLRDELSRIIARDMEFDGSLATITEVEMSRKLDLATVRISVWPTEHMGEVVSALNNAKGRIRKALSTRVRTRSLPALEFTEDYGPANAAGVEETLRKETH